MDTLLKNCTLIDGTGREPIADVAGGAPELLFPGDATYWATRRHFSPVIGTQVMVGRSV